MKAFLVLAVALCAPQGIAQTLSWRIQLPVNVPTSRSSPAMAEDGVNGGVVMFGGLGSAGPLGDTWTWDGSDWTATTPKTAPSPRWGAGAAWDPVRKVVVLFGGLGTGVLGDTWEWDGTGWTLVQPTTAPPARYEHGMTYDSASGKVLLYGGQTATEALGDTWTWDGKAWTKVADLYPIPRYRPSMALDETRKVVVLFGGYGGEPQRTLSDTWEWDGAQWKPMLYANRPSSNWSDMVWDDLRKRCLLRYEHGPMYLYENGGWTYLGATAKEPAGRMRSGFAYDRTRSQTVLFGGELYFPLQDTWVLDDGPVPGRWVPYGKACGPTPLVDLSSPDTPRLGKPLQVVVGNLTDKATIALLAVGAGRTSFGNFPLPIPMDAYGMTGCLALHDFAAGTWAMSVSGSSATLGLTVPNTASLLQTIVYFQGIVYDPTGNPAGLLMTQGAQLLIGQ
ncbi:MAG: kelch repeat-containing protein [Planctomycetota bacterium]